MLMNVRVAARRIRPITVSNCCTCWEFKGQEIGDRGGKEIQLMLMMLALRLAESVQIAVSNCCTCQGQGRTKARRSEREVERKSS